MKKKTVMIISILAVMVLAVGGILAYLTDTSSVTNTFTVGNVDIVVDEAKVDEEGKATFDANGEPIRVSDTTNEDGELVPANTYHLIPGMTYVKDPTMSIAEKSEESYVRMVVKVEAEDLTKVDAVFDALDIELTDLFLGYDPAIWVYNAEGRNGNTIAYEFRYKEKVSGLAEGEGYNKLPALFTKLVIPGAINNEQLAAIDGLKITVEGHAIQAAGFEADAEKDMTVEDVAWAAFDKEYEGEIVY